MDDLGKCGRFALERPIGAGGMGEIFLAKDPDERPVAIKRLLRECAGDPVFIGMFLDEARLVERLQHPNVCEVFEHGLEGQHYFLVMEHVDGLSLKELLDRRGHAGLPFPLACRIVAEVASALDYAHRVTDELGRPLGLVHRDVSPANVMIARDGAVKLLDFGLAKARTQIMKTQPGLVKGKFGYLAPEQLGGKVDWRTDIFSLGLCLYEALTGRQLFGQRSAAETVQAIQQFAGPPPLAGTVPGVTPALDAVLAKALARAPEDRFESAAAFRAALGRAVMESGHAAVSADALAAEVQAHMAAEGGSSAGSIRPPSVAPPGGTERRWWALVAAIALVLAVAAGITVWLAA